jgi:hypothetical protein
LTSDGPLRFSSERQYKNLNFSILTRIRKGGKGNEAYEFIRGKLEKGRAYGLEVNQAPTGG